MKTAFVLMDFRPLSDANLENRGAYIARCMKGNAYFPNPAPTIEELETAVANFGTALIDAKSRDSIKISIKNQMRQKLDQILVKLARYVNFVADGDRAIIISAGYTPSIDNTGINTES